MDSKVKYIEIVNQFIKNVECDKNIELVKINSKLNQSDTLFKVVTWTCFRKHSATFQVCIRSTRRVYYQLLLYEYIYIVSCFCYYLVLLISSVKNKFMSKFILELSAE